MPAATPLPGVSGGLLLALRPTATAGSACCCCSCCGSCCRGLCARRGDARCRDAAAAVLNALPLPLRQRWSGRRRLQAAEGMPGRRRHEANSSRSGALCGRKPRAGKALPHSLRPAARTAVGHMAAPAACPSQFLPSKQCSAQMSGHQHRPAVAPSTGGNATSMFQAAAAWLIWPLLASRQPQRHS